MNTTWLSWMLVAAAFAVGLADQPDGSTAFKQQISLADDVRGTTDDSVAVDAVQQARRLVPSARFIRALEGDSLAKVAAQYEVDLEVLARLNRTTPAKVYADPAVVCLDWRHEVADDESLESIARHYNTRIEVIAAINANVVDSPTAKIRPGMRLRVPGEFTYHYRRDGNCRLVLTRYARPRDGDPQPPTHDVTDVAESTAARDSGVFRVMLGKQPSE